MYDKSWTTGSFTEEDVYKLGTHLVNQIKINNGIYNSTLTSICLACGYEPEGDSVVNYGGLFRAMQVVKKRYHISSKSLGCKGNQYTLTKDSITGNQESAEMIVSLVESIDFNTLSPDKSVNILKLIKKIIEEGKLNE